MTAARRRRKRAQSSRVERLCRQMGNDEFPASVGIYRRSQRLARLVSEADYQEMAQLMAEHLRHLACEAKRDAIPLEDVLNSLRQRREARRLARGSGE